MKENLGCLWFNFHSIFTQCINKRSFKLLFTLISSQSINTSNNRNKEHGRNNEPIQDDHYGVYDFIRCNKYHWFINLYLAYKFQNTQYVFEGGSYKLFFHPYMQVNLSFINLGCHYLFRIIFVDFHLSFHEKNLPRTL